MHEPFDAVVDAEHCIVEVQLIRQNWNSNDTAGAAALRPAVRSAGMRLFVV